MQSLQDLYNIFLYFQSQLLTRLCLTILFARKSAFKFLQKDVPRIQKEFNKATMEMTQYTDLLDNSRLLRDKLEMLAEAESTTAQNYYSSTLSKIKRSSLDLLSRLIAVSNEYQNINNAIQAIAYNSQISDAEKSNYSGIALRMRQIQQSFSDCQNDHLTLLLTYDSFLFKSFNMKSEKVRITKSEHVAKNDIETAENNNDDAASSLSSENNDYFALRDSSDEFSSDDEDDAADKKASKGNYNVDEELANLDLKINKKYFAPVLKQLKTKIDPIKNDMNQRERRYLMSKGVDPEKLSKFSAKHSRVGLANSSHSDTDSDESKPKVPRSKQNFDEMRKFLQQKQQFSLLPPSDNTTLPLTGTEDIIE